MRRTMYPSAGMPKAFPIATSSSDDVPVWYCGFVDPLSENSD